MRLAADLRAAVYQQAIEGKLTTHISSDSPVHVNLEGKKKGLKKPIKKVYDEVLNASVKLVIPSYWEKHKLYDVSISVSDGDHQPPPQTQDGVPFVVISNISDGAIDLSLTRHVSEEYFNGLSEDRKAENGDILFSVTGSYGIVIVVRNQPKFCFQRHIALIKIEREVILEEYLAIVLRSPYVKQLCDKVATGIAQKTVGIKTLQSIVVPVPPIEEQQRIVDRVNELMPMIDEYERMENRLVALKEAFPGDLRDAILQAAFKGEMTGGEKADTPVPITLKQIKEEKEALILSGKIDKGKPLPEIDDSEIPFSIPDEWVWKRWGEISFSIQYGYNAPAFPSGRIKMVRISDIQRNSVIWDTVPFCEIPEKEIETYLLKKNDILFARTGGTVGKSYIVNDVPEPAIYAGYLIRTQYSNRLVPRYLKYFMESQLYWNQLRNGTKVSAQPNCNGKTLSKMIIPIPPIEEQQRIVDRLNAILPLCDALSDT